jgi:two-component system, OmpR family, response regulator
MRQRRNYGRMTSMVKGNVLIAEDDPVLRNLYIKKFSVAGYDIRAVEDGEAALAAFAERLPDIAVLDIHMPKMDGFQVLEKFPPNIRTFPVIMLTNFADERSKARGQELGANNYFVKKDMTIRSLLEMVESELGKWRAAHPN